MQKNVIVKLVILTGHQERDSASERRRGYVGNGVCTLPSQALCPKVRERRGVTLATYFAESGFVWNLNGFKAVFVGVAMVGGTICCSTSQMRSGSTAISSLKHWEQRCWSGRGWSELRYGTTATATNSVC